MCIGINAGCTGYVDALFMIYKLLKPNEEALIVTSDTYSKYIDSNKTIVSELRKEILKTIQSLKGKITVIIVTHKKNILDYCDKIYGLSQGNIIQINNVYNQD